MRQQADDPDPAAGAAGQPRQAAGDGAQEDKTGSNDHRNPTP